MLAVLMAGIGVPAWAQGDGNAKGGAKKTPGALKRELQGIDRKMQALWKTPSTGEEQVRKAGPPPPSALPAPL